MGADVALIEALLLFILLAVSRLARWICAGVVAFVVVAVLI